MVVPIECDIFRYVGRTTLECDCTDIEEEQFVARFWNVEKDMGKLMCMKCNIFSDTFSAEYEKVTGSLIPVWQKAVEAFKYDPPELDDSIYED